MKNDTRVLKGIYENASTGKGTLERVIKTIGEENITNDLKKQLKGYDGFCTISQKMLKKQGVSDTSDGPLRNFTVDVGVKMNLIMDISSAHVAGLLIEGSNMGVVDLTKILNKNKNISTECKALADGLIKFEEENIQNLKPYL